MKLSNTLSYLKCFVRFVLDFLMPTNLYALFDCKIQLVASKIIVEAENHIKALLLIYICYFGN
uniref:Hypothetical secreted peptide n=1 Tax=Glossina morsitans morsitans TaxID=37546 RepID=D3TSQ5_GLOMM